MKQRLDVIILLLLALFLSSTAVYSQISANYYPNNLYDGREAALTWRFKYPGGEMDVPHYYWVDGKKTVSGVSCWRMFDSDNGFYQTVDYGICYYAVVDNEMRLYLQEFFDETGISWRKTYSPYEILWKYDVELGDEWTQEYSYVAEEISGAESHVEESGTVLRTTRIVNYENITTDFDTYANALKIEETTGNSNQVDNTWWYADGVGVVLGDSAYGVETHVNYEIVSDPPSSETNQVLPEAMDITGGGIAGVPTFFTVDASDESAGSLYYKFFYCANYGTPAYEGSPWVVMQEYSTSNSLSYTFSQEGSYVVVARIVTDPNNEPADLPIIGGVISIGIGFHVSLSGLSCDATGDTSAGEPVTYTVSGSILNNDTIYYKWFYRANYGTSDYDTSPWVVVQDYVANNSCEFTFPSAGKYVVVVRAVTDPNNEPADLPIIGGVISIK